MISTVILTLNEEVNLPYCLGSLRKCDDIVVVDSFSSDRTCEIARSGGARVVQNRFTGFGDQITWALGQLSFKHPWVMILDADERVPPGLWSEMTCRVGSCSAEVAAYQVKRRFFWQGRCLRHANLYPTWVVRLVRIGRVTYRNVGHAEAATVDGRIESLEEDLLDENHKGIGDWHERQRRYAEQEARHEFTSDPAFAWRDLWSPEPLVRRGALKVFARRLPARGSCYFIYSWLLRGGWRDGWHGLRFCLAKARYQGMIAKMVRALQRGGTT